MKEIDAGLKRTEAEARRNHLVRELNKLGVHRAKDGRHFDWLELPELENLHISVKCDVGRAFGER